MAACESDWEYKTGEANWAFESGLIETIQLQGL